MLKATEISFRKKRAFDVFRAYRQVQSKIHDLRYLFWECTLRCNLKCRHCGSDCIASSDVPDMPKEDFLRVIDEIKPLVDSKKTMIAITGGEPLMRDDLEEVGYQLYKREFPWGMVCNGYALGKERFVELLKSGMGSLTISLDGLKGSHDWMRAVNGSFEKAIRAVEMAANTKNLVFDVVTCVNQKNIGELEKIKKLLIDCNVKKWRVFTIFPKGRAEGDEMLTINPLQYKYLADFIVKTKSEGKIRASYSCAGFTGGYEGHIRDYYFFCKAGINIGSILVDGSISACPSLRNDYIQGNIYKDSFWDVWENRFQVMRNRSWTKKGECEKCTVYKWCGGNGLHLRDEKTGGLLMCQYNLLKKAEAK